MVRCVVKFRICQNDFLVLQIPRRRSIFSLVLSGIRSGGKAQECGGECAIGISVPKQSDIIKRQRAFT